MLLKVVSSLLCTLALLSGCAEDKKQSITEGSMKCGPGKCGASMVDGSDILVKKKMNILAQLRDSDDRRACVLSAISTKEVYNCVRVEETGRLSTKCASDNTKQLPKKETAVMKCEAGKCGNNM